MANEFIVRKGLIVTDNIKLLDNTGNNVIEIDDNGNNSSIFFNRHEGNDALSFQWQTNKRLLFASQDNQSGDGILYAYGDVGATSNSSDGGQIFTSPLSYVNKDSLLGSYEFRTFGTSGTRASIKGVATENQGASNKGTKLEFHVTEKGNNSLSKILTLNFETGSIFEGNISASGDITATTVSASYVYFPNNDFVINSLDSTFNLDFDFPSGGNRRTNFNLSSANDVVNVSQVNTSNTTGGHLIITTDGYQAVEGNSYGTLSFGDVSYNLAQIKGTSIQDATNNNRGTSLDFYTTPSGSQTAVKTVTFNTSSQFIETGSYGYPSLIVGDPTLVGGVGGNALGFWVSESSDSIYHSNIAVHSVGEGWQDILSFTRDEGTTIGGVTSNFQFPNLVTIGSIDKGIKLKATGSTGEAEDLFFQSAGGSGQMKLLIGPRNADNNRYQIELKDNGTGSFEGDLDVGNTGSFAHLKATVIEGNSPLTLRGVSSLTFDTNPGEITFNNTDLRGNPVFHGDVNVYSGSAFLDQVDAVIFRSTNTTIPVDGFLQLGDNSTPTELRGSNITLTSALTASAISASGDITITINGGTF